MSSSNPFDQESLMYKLMKYLYKIEQQMEVVSGVWIFIDLVQFLTIATSLLGYVIKVHFNMVGEELFDNILNIFFNYSKIYDWLVISGAVSAMIVIGVLVVYLGVEFRQEVKEDTKKKLLSYCALTGTVSIGLFEFFSQVMANNLINIVARLLRRELQMDLMLVGFFLLNMVMMVFVSIFNAERRIFRFSLVLVSLGLNMLNFTLTCAMLAVLSIYYQYLDKLVYKKLFYSLIIAICIWCSLQVNDSHSHQLTSREVYLGMSVVAIIAYYLHYDHEFIGLTYMEENQYLVKLYNKKLKKEDTKEDYLLADQFFSRYFNREREGVNVLAKHIDADFFLTSSVQAWAQHDFKQRIIEKIKTERFQTSASGSIASEVAYFELLLELKINMVELLEEVFEFMSAKRNENIKVISQVNRLTNKIEMEFSKMPDVDQGILKINQIIELQQFYKKFYHHYLAIVDLLQQIFEGLDNKNGQITDAIEQRLTDFTRQQQILQITLKNITDITGPKLESKLYTILSQIWGKYQKNQSSHQLENVQQYGKLPHQQSKEKFNFSYIVISNKNIKYASIKFLSTYSYKESYITGQSMSLIFPKNFSLFVTDLIEKNAGNKVFTSQLPVLNQKGMFEIVSATFYLIPEFKGEVTYIIQFKKIYQFESKSLFLLNCETYCIESFNKRMIEKFRLSMEQINTLLETEAIQLTSLFIFSNDEKDFHCLVQKSVPQGTKANKKMTVDNQAHAVNQRHIKDNDKPSSVKALMKMDYLSHIKKSVGRNVTLEAEITYDISNITYKLVKLEDASVNKQNEGSVTNERTDEINFYKELNKTKEEGFQNSTKDLKKKYVNEDFFCPISNPYTPRILQKLNQINSSGRMNNLTLIKIIYSVGSLFLLCGMIGFKILTEDFSSSILQFQKQAQAINKQYSYFMTGVLRAYELQNMEINAQTFVSYIEQTRGVGRDESEQLYKEIKTYVEKEKMAMIKKYQDVYFDYPILYDSEAVPVELFTPFFVLNSTSQTTLIYDMVLILLDSQSESVKQIIALNFGIYETLAKILRPDGRYIDKIESLDNEPGYILIAPGVVVVICFCTIYYCLYQLREAREDIILIYKYIDKKEIDHYINKVEEIQELIQILSNSKKNNENSLQKQQNLNIYSSVSELNSATNLQKEFMDNNDNVNSVSYDEKPEGQNQSEGLLESVPSKENGSHFIRKKYTSESKLSILLQTFLNYPIYLLFMLVNCAILAYAYYEAHLEAGNYMQAFNYFEKIRAANFQTRYLYVISQSYPYYWSVVGQPYTLSHPYDFQQKKTHFEYEKPQDFKFSTQQNLCSPWGVSQIQDPLLISIKCQQIGNSVLAEGFSRAYEQYEKDLRILSIKSYEQIFAEAQDQSRYFTTIYSYFIFGNYLDRLTDENFSENIKLMGENAKQNLTIIFSCSFGWAFLAFGFIFGIAFPKIESELSTIISMIKMIPPETLFSMKVAAIIKKRDILHKLNRF